MRLPNSACLRRSLCLKSSNLSAVVFILHTFSLVTVRTVRSNEHKRMTTANHTAHSAQSDFTSLVKKALIDRKLNQVKLARLIGKSRTAVTIAINHPTMFLDTQDLIRRELDL